jgi:putative membrane protein
MGLMTAGELQEVEAAIAAAEARTAGEIVVAVVGQSDRYDLARGVAAAGWTLATALVWRWWQPDGSCLAVLLGQVPVGLAFWAVAGWPPLMRLLVRGQRAQAAVQARAYQLFASQGVHQTRDHSGLLILISELEHRVVILGDRGIHTALGDTGWEGHVRTLVQGIKTRRTGPALIEVVRRLGDTLASRFPRRPDDVNELPDAVVRE